jgi:NitT/TauT family transport system permease protein
MTEMAQTAKPATAATSRPRQVKRNNVFDSMIGRSVLQILAVVCFFLIWEGAVQMGWLSAFLVGQPSGVLHNLVASITNGSLFADTGYTVFEAILGFAFGTVIGSVIGLALWYSVFVARLVEPFIAAINSVPKIALAPIIILWFGTGLLSKVALAISLTSIVALITAYQAAKDSDKDLQALLFSMGASKHHIFKRVIVPSTLPAIIATFRINIGFALVGAVVGEFISSQRGLGHVIYVASSLYDLNTVWAGLFTLMLVGFAFYHMVEITERHLLPWKQQQGGGQINV